ncbi:right-handed parallel beta-helix repeat-containing protein [Longispora albida]|uniref:right-handed parallel beta-helix repeat-containing protein n=1 Tax=Longispora albida TaxID=203523 RepID=UPI001B7FD8A4|nr:right-handed parallel beta-helix repeat-containing protein [Longispora albida]
MAMTVVLVMALAGCSVSDEDPARRPAGSGPVTIRVPADAATISAAVGAARPGDLVLVSPGVYREKVRITRPGVTLRGADRNKVVIDGEGKRSDGVVVTAAGVSVENLTVTRHLFNGVLVTGMTDESGTGIGRGSDGYQTLDPKRFPPVRDFAVRYVTASNNGLYGIYAFDATAGVIEDNYASGGADSGFYVGQCKPCDTVVRRNVAERNAVGFENANASGGLYVVGNRFTANRVGLTIASNYQEALIPQQQSVVAGNLIGYNDQQSSPAHAEGGFGIGVGISGGRDNLIARNRIAGNPAAGVVLASAEDLAPLGNRVLGNTLEGNGLDVAYAASARAPGERNCFDGNSPATEAPAGLLAAAPCPAGNAKGPGVPYPQLRQPGGLSFLEVPAPPDQPGMPDPARMPAQVKVLPPSQAEIDSLPVPDAALFADRAGASR